MSEHFVNRQRMGKNFNQLRRKNFGVIAIEVCFTLPIVIYLIFFTIELIKINITQDALQSICEEATYLTISHDYENSKDLISKVDNIIEKYRPVFIPKKGVGYEDGQPVIRWVYESYSDFSDILTSAPYGGTTVTYPWYEGDEPAYMHASQCYREAQSQFIPANGMECPAIPEHWDDTYYYMYASGLPNNRVFVLTVTCNYPFSSSLVKWLFNGGVNTKFVTFNEGYGIPPRKATGPKGTMYLLWARGAGIVNVK